MLDIINQFERIRDLPYRIPLENGEKDTCCAGKAILLKKVLEEAGYEARYRVCTFNWNELNLPKALKYMKHDKISEHVFLELKIWVEWIDIDPTWDKWLYPTFEINERDGKTSTLIAVPLIELYDAELSEKIMTESDVHNNDRERNYDFYLVLNKWMEGLRWK